MARYAVEARIFGNGKIMAKVRLAQQARKAGARKRGCAMCGWTSLIPGRRPNAFVRSIKRYDADRITHPRAGSLRPGRHPAHRPGRAHRPGAVLAAAVKTKPGRRKFRYE